MIEGSESVRLLKQKSTRINIKMYGIWKKSVLTNGVKVLGRVNKDDKFSKKLLQTEKHNEVCSITRTTNGISSNFKSLLLFGKYHF